MIAEGVAGARRRDPEAGAFALPIAGGMACWAGAESPLNKVIGVGFAGPLSETELAAVEGAYAERGAPVQVELASLSEPALGAQLSRRGYRLMSFENVLAADLEGLDSRLEPPPGSDPEIADSGAEELGLWLDVVVTGFAHPDLQGLPATQEFPRAALERVMRDLVTGAGCRRYLARRGGEPAGGASLRVDDRIAQLCGAATLPAHRRRGVQTALLAHRLNAARAAGCKLAVVTTQPGSKSQENVQRLGFHVLYVRAILVREHAAG